MNNLLHIYKVVLLLLLTCLLITDVTSFREGSSYFFYQQPEYPRDCKEARDLCSSNNLSGVYTIKPDGYPQPFEVYCNNEILSGGWTVFQRQIDGSVTFTRDWQDYKKGFGFFSGELWIGLDRLSFLTNQAVYELRIDITLFNGSSFYVNYNYFRISDEQGSYAIVSAEEFRSNWSCLVSFCHRNMTRETCTCQNMCTYPIGQTNCHTECIETCVPEGCLITETDSYISNGESYINTDCTQNCTCIDNQLSCNTDYACSPDATCTVKDEIRKCYCNGPLEGDGETCFGNRFTDCYDVYQAGHTTDGIYSILPSGWPGSSFEVFCNMTFLGGGWTVFQRRIDGITDFYRDWEDYKVGFGSLQANKDFWLGNEKLYYLTNQNIYRIRTDLINENESPSYYEHSSFRIGDESTKYQLSVGSFVGGGSGSEELGDSNGGQFSTRDQDNDGCHYHDCAKGHKGGWWYTTAVYSDWCRECYSSSSYCDLFQTRNSCHDVCTSTNPNGEYGGINGQNIFTDGCNDKFIEMKIRPSSV